MEVNGIDFPFDVLRVKKNSVSDPPRKERPKTAVLILIWVQIPPSGFLGITGMFYLIDEIPFMFVFWLTTARETKRGVVTLSNWGVNISCL